MFGNANYIETKRALLYILFWAAVSGAPAIAKKHIQARVTPSCSGIAARLKSLRTQRNAASGASSALACGPPQRAMGNWKMVWSDEFDGTSLDTTKWTAVEKQGNIVYYTRRLENVSVAAGHLNITALDDNYRSSDGATHHYTSGYITSKYHADWAYGAFEVRAKLSAGQGMHPAIWMLPVDNAYGPWPNSGEIDIMESEGSAIRSVYGSIHYGIAGIDDANKAADQGSRGTLYRLRSNAYALPSGTFSDAFHVFRLEWEPGEMRWYTDGALYSTQRKWLVDGNPYPAPFDQRFYLILNLAMVGYTGGPDVTTPFPNIMMVDYVRVYRKE
jgi:beta-glucanase (GH16 family)